MSIHALLQAFVTVFPAELPDKSMFATIVLVTRYRRPGWVWVGVVAAFTVKHEMLSWMERCTHRYKDEFNVYRTRDNPRGHAPDEKPDVTPFNE